MIDQQRCMAVEEGAQCEYVSLSASDVYCPKHALTIKPKSTYAVLFRAGNGQPSEEKATGFERFDGAPIVFQAADGKDILRLNGDGTILVNGEVTAYRKDVYDAFLRWLSAACARAFKPESGDLSLMVQTKEK